MNEIEASELARRLVEIQAIDTRILALEKEVGELAEVHRLSELATELADAREALADKGGDLEELEHKQHKVDGELDLLSKKVTSEEEKLFSGTIMNPKELSSIQQEILSLRKRRDEMETEDLEEMEAIDLERSEGERLASLVNDLEARERAAIDVYNRELKDKQEEIAVLEAERHDMKAAIDPEIVERYERLLAEKGGVAVVRIEGGRSCGGCRLEFSSSQIDRFQHEEGIFRCENCRRILVK